MHNLTASFQILDRFQVVLGVNLQYTSVKVKVFFVEDVFFVVVGVSFFFAFIVRRRFLVKLIRLIPLKLSVEFFDFSVVKL